MGLVGWNVLPPGVTTFTAVVPPLGATNPPPEGYASGLFGDDDWSLFVVPDDWKWMRNSNGMMNQDHWVECEVQPPPTFAGFDAKDPATEQRFLRPFAGTRVTVGGTFCEDLSHDSRTELHSLDWILSDPQPFAGSAKQSQFIVTSDAASFDPHVRWALPPNCRTNRIREWEMLFPTPPAGVSDADWYHFSFVEEVDASARKVYEIRTNAQGQRVLFCHIESGTCEQNQGFYAATVELGQSAVFVSQTVPTTMAAGGRASVSITMRNTSNDTWQNYSSGPMTQFPFGLGSQDPQDNTTWGTGRVTLPTAVAPKATVTFTFVITAPTTPGTYPFQWRMVHDRVRWFGMSTPVANIQVTPVQVDCAALSAQLTSLNAQATRITNELAHIPAGPDGVEERAQLLQQLAPITAQAKQVRTQMSEGGCRLP